MIPGANLLSMAARVITLATVQHLAFTGRQINSVGDYVDAYADPVDVQGSVQAVDTKTYQQMGLDFKRTYVYLFTNANVRAVSRDRAGDKFIFNNETFLCESDVGWQAIDGWRYILCVRVPS